jgi:transposase
MARAFSDDLRCRLLEAYERGGVSMTQLAVRFGVSWGYVRKIRQQELDYGQKERRRQSRYGPVSRVTATVAEQLRSWVAKQPDLTLAELQERLAASAGVELSRSRLWTVLQGMGLRRKKNPSTRKSRKRKLAESGGRPGGKR